MLCVLQPSAAKERARFLADFAVMNTASKLGPTHKRTEERAPVWGSEFTLKDATGHWDSKELLPCLCVVGLHQVASCARVYGAAPFKSTVS
jgi:hypothetical protein